MLAKNRQACHCELRPEGFSVAILKFLYLISIVMVGIFLRSFLFFDARIFGLFVG